MELSYETVDTWTWAVNIKEHRGPELWSKAIPFFLPHEPVVYIMYPPPPHSSGDRGIPAYVIWGKICKG